MIPVCTPSLGIKEREYILDCLQTNWISSHGKYISSFEEAFSAYCGQKYGITTTNGTTALHLALAVLGIKPGDEVIMPSFTIASTAFAVIYCGARPVFVDSEPDTWNIDPSLIESKITKKTKAIMPVHVYGHPCDMAPITALAKKYKLFVIEDAAEAHGAEYRGQKAGSFGDLSCFSFYGNKIITTGEGGMVLTSDKKLAHRCRYLKNLTFQEPKRFWHKEIGFNYRMTNLQAALGLAQFERIEELIKCRRRNAQQYNSHLVEIKGLTLPVERDNCRNVYWMYGLVVEKEFGMSRQKFMEKLLDKGVETRIFFVPMHQQPIMKKMGVVSLRERYPIAEELGRGGMYLPSGSDLKREEIEYICASIKEIQRKG